MSDFNGHFGLDLEHLVPGVLCLEDDGSFVLQLTDFIFKPEQLDTSQPNTVSFSGDPAKVVADYMPRDIVGVLANGEPVTLFRALMKDPMFLFTSARQTFQGSMALVGAHLSDERDTVAGIRWTWRLPADMDLQRGRSSEAVPGLVPGVLEEWGREQGLGLQFRATRVTPLQTLRNQVQLYCSQLLGLWTAEKVPGVTHTEVLVGSRWCVLHVQVSDQIPLRHSSFMPVQDLSLEMFAAWIPLAHKVDPFPFILNGLSNTLQLDAQVLATALEGLHRRLHVDRPRLEGIAQRAVDRAAKQARHAGVERLQAEGYTDEDKAQSAFRETLRHLNQMTYQQRAVDLLEPVRQVVPSLFGPDLLKWIGIVKNIRNHQSHQLAREFDEPSISIYYVAVESCRWAMVLRILLELRPGYDFKSNLGRSNRFSFALANIDREKLWPEFSALADFRAHVQGNAVEEPEAHR
ncbi:hypothetical protein J2S98_002516 [Arthrobacter oryzae]|uniref:HEPN domain-containing protein n=1 Tax=Arthrobacter oryzae TaxID=409290 RepID=UPI002787DD77|nr:HEPN domain-containing protein [Arthrobacter oryzae]MDP9987349.1 hypothetical protein [Arthrobacter oryzae]